MAVDVGAQQPGSSAIIQALGNLSPDQQQALLQRLGRQVGAPPTGQATPGAAQNNFPATPNSSASDRAQASDQTLQDFNGGFEPEDSLLLDINLPGERTVAQQAADRYEQGSKITPLPAPVGTDTTTQATGSSATPDTATGAPVTTAPATPATPMSSLDAATLEAAHDLLKMLNANNPYKLDADGVLQLPGFRPIELAGLTENEATRRISSEPALQNFEVRVIRLPLVKSGAAALKPFGYDLFDASKQGLAPVTSIPAPDDYVVGAGDTFEIQLYGSQNYSLELAVSRDGVVNVPQLGPINVGGKRYAEARREIETRVAKQMIGVHAAVSLGDTRSISVFVLGEAMYPGSYPVAGMATVTTALFAAGGAKPEGSLRSIQVRRRGTLIREFDLYDLLMHGDSSNDVKLEPGDVVMIPPVGPTASVDGEVRRPAIYELKGPTTVATLVEMAGGLSAEGDSGRASLVHVNEQRQRVAVSVDLSMPATQSPAVGNGDALRIARLKPTLDSGVTLKGYVYRPGQFAWREGLRLTDVISSIDELKPNADQNYVLIRRVLTPGRRISVLSADLAAALGAPDSSANVQLQPRDTITVFDLQTGRDRIIEPLMQELALQSSLLQPTEVVRVDGKVKVPGEYPLETGMRVADLIRAGGNLAPSAYGGRAELSRFIVEQGERRRTEIINIDLAAVARGDETANVLLNPYDALSVKGIPDWDNQDQVILTGEVRLPGTYAIRRGETLRSVIERAGGLTDLAFPAGAVFTRDELREHEQEELDRLADRMRSDIASMALMAARVGQSLNANSEYNIGQSLLSQIKSTKAMGRLVINLNAAIHAAPGTSDDIALRGGDQLAIPRLRQEVMVMGEVQSASSHLFAPDLTRDDYIAQSGGFTSQADRKRIYVVRADGSVVPAGRHWLVGFGGEAIHPGDTVVVPLDTERLPRLPLWQAVTQILYNIAISSAAISRL